MSPKPDAKSPPVGAMIETVRGDDWQSRFEAEHSRALQLEEVLRRTRGGADNRLALLANLLLEALEDPEANADFFNPTIGADGKAPRRCWLDEPDCPRAPGLENFGERMRTCSECDVFQKLSPDAYTRLGEIIQATLFLLRQKHQQFMDTQQQLIQSEKLAGLGELAAGLAHEINTPTGIILSRLDCMDGDGPITPVVREDLKVIRRHAERLKRITSSLTSFARRHKVEKRIVVIQELMRELLEILERTMNSANVISVVDLPEKPMIVFADPTMIQQVFMNIILNARDAMPAGGTLIIRGSLQGDKALVEFQDTGIGMEDSVRKRVFDPFFTTKESHGTGLGLSISYSIIKDHKGAIEVESAAGEGSLFRLILPVHNGGIE